MNIKDAILIGSGAQADIYLYENKAVKIYKTECSQGVARYEAELQEKAYKAGLPAPLVYEVIEIDGRSAIVMEFIQGKPLGEIMLEDMERAHEYLGASVDLQIRIHKVNAEGFPSQRDRLKSKIMSNPYLTGGQRERLSRSLRGLPKENQLCHGDYHVLNLLQSGGGIKVIDWIDASGGVATLDVCRSYLIYLLHQREIAEFYLDIYCGKANMPKREVLEWLPVIAGARLSENVTAKDAETLIKLVDGRAGGMVY